MPMKRNDPHAPSRSLITCRACLYQTWQTHYAYALEIHILQGSVHGTVHDQLDYRQACARWMPKGACTHTGKTGAGSDSGAGCNVNKWVFSHAAGPTQLPVRQISVPDLNLTSRAPAYQFQCNCIGTCTRV